MRVVQRYANFDAAILERQDVGNASRIELLMQVWAIMACVRSTMA